MTVKTYYVSKVGNQNLSTNFKVKEFQCNDGTDKVLIDTDLVVLLQKIRDHFGKPVNISSAYRTASYNASVGGSSSSNHVKGMAADIQVSGVNPVIVAMYAETIGAGGIGLYAYSSGGFNHIDTRGIKYRWLTILRGANYEAVPKFMPTARQGITNVLNVVKLIQRNLGISQSGTFGDATTAAVKNFQSKNKLTVDGIVGPATWRKMFS